MMNWSAAFVKCLAAKGLSQQEALFSLRLAGIKTQPSSISCWCRGAAYPRESTRKLIEKWSAGKVRASLPPADESGTSLEQAKVAS